MYSTILLAASSLSSALAYPNVLPKYQQEIIQPTPGVHADDSVHFQSTIRDVLLANQIIPQVLDDFEPNYYLDLSYTKDNERVLMGNDIPVNSVSKRPIFTFHPLSGPPSYDDPSSDNNLTFTLILTDPDALSRKHPVKSEMCHWIMTNLTTPLSDDNGTEWPEPIGEILETMEDDVPETYLDMLEEEFSVSSKKPGEVRSYQPPTPPKKTGPHRYVFVLLEGDATHLVPPKERPHWGYGKERHGVRDWAGENDLTVVGANFFFAEHKKQK